MILLSSVDKAIIKKDIGEIWNSIMARLTLLVIPLLMALILPALFLAILYYMPLDHINGVDRMLQMLPEEAKLFSARQGMFYFMTNMVCPAFFLIIPLMSSAVSAANSFIGEKERETMETLILTPLTTGRIFKAKVFGCIFLSAVITVISFAGFSVVISVGDLLLGMPFFLNWNWLVLFLLFAPGVAVFSVLFMVAVSGKSKSYMESCQMSGYLVLPILLLFLAQFMGLFTINAFLLLMVSLGVFIFDILLWIIIKRLFSVEKLIQS